MLIKNISIENFQCYFGQQSDNVFQFSEGVNIIAGSNGSGKSKLFNAFHWVLFGQIYSNHQWEVTENRGYKYVSKKAMAECDDGESIRCSVKLIFDAHNLESGNKDVEYTFSRKIVIQKHGGNWKVVTPETLSISYKKENGETEFLDSMKNDHVIDHIFPPALRKYMWFQGEAIDSLLDFNNPNTLKFAIKKISYYPFYERIHEITSATNAIISRNIAKHLRKSKKSSDELKKILHGIELKNQKLDAVKADITEAKSKYDRIKQRIHETETALKNYDGFQDFERKLNDIEHRDEKISWAISNLEIKYREKFITKWMLRGTESLLKTADSILDQFINVIKEKSETDNPIPLKIPGNKFIQQMLDDYHCHICERPAIKNSDAYKAISKRLIESTDLEAEAKEKTRIYKDLEISYLQLADKPSNLIVEIKNIDVEIKDWDKKMNDLFQQRIECKREKERLEADNDIKDIKKGARTAANLTHEFTFYKDEEKNQSNYIRRLESERIHLQKDIDDLTKKRKEFEDDDEKIVEQEAEIYFTLLESMSHQLKEKALLNLISDIEKRANILYKKYLENSQSPDGYLSIDPESYEILVLDDGKRKDINQGHEVAAKMSVINSILSLSSEKLGRSYPLVADAPSSVFDKVNTKSYTQKISETFKQVILISKDYSTDMDMEFLNGIEQIKRVYQIENKIINDTLVKSEINNRTFINLVKPLI